MSDKYFKEKASEFIDLIDSGKIIFDETIIIFLLKEVARDQKNACIDAYHNHNLSKQCVDSFIEGIIQNAEIKRE